MTSKISSLKLLMKTRNLFTTGIPPKYLILTGIKLVFEMINSSMCSIFMYFILYVKINFFSEIFIPKMFNNS